VRRRPRMPEPVPPEAPVTAGPASPEAPMEQGPPNEPPPPAPWSRRHPREVRSQRL